MLQILAVCGLEYSSAAWETKSALYRHKYIHLCEVTWL